MKRALFILLFVLSFFTPITSHAVQGDIQNISLDKYYQATLDALNSAKESVFVVMYDIAYDPFNKESKPYNLLQALISAHKRGVKVTVILDQNLELADTDAEPLSDWELMRAKNITVYSLLKKEGVDVLFDVHNVVTHSKVIIIDDEIVILGSANWSERGLNQNIESNLLVKSKAIAESVRADFKDIATQIPHVITQDASVNIPSGFLREPKLLARMATQNDSNAFDLYLELLRYKDKDAVTVSYDTLIKDLNLTQAQPRERINRTLERLRDTYGLISFDDKDIFRKDSLTLKLTSFTDTKSIDLPLAYFNYGWGKKLSLRAKTLYLVSLAYYTVSDSKPWFFASREDIQDKFHLKVWYTSNGMQELRQLNVIDIKYSDYNKESPEHKIANYYKILGLYDPKKVDEKFSDLSKRYGEAQVQKARHYAEVVFKENDTGTVEELIHLMTDYGKWVVLSAVEIVAKKRVDNPKRNFAYLKAIIEKSKSQPQK